MGISPSYPDSVIVVGVARVPVPSPGHPIPKDGYQLAALRRQFSSPKVISVAAATLGAGAT